MVGASAILAFLCHLLLHWIIFSPMFLFWSILLLGAKTSHGVLYFFMFFLKIKFCWFGNVIIGSGYEREYSSGSEVPCDAADAFFLVSLIFNFILNYSLRLYTAFNNLDTAVLSVHEMLA